MLKRYQRAKNDPVLSVSIIDESSPPDVATARAVDASRNARGATAAGRDGTLDDTRWIMAFFCFRGCGSPKATALLAVRARTAVTSFMLGQSRRSVPQVAEPALASESATLRENLAAASLRVAKDTVSPHDQAAVETPGDGPARSLK